MASALNNHAWHSRSAVQVGSFDAFSGRVLIADPCYAFGEEGEHLARTVAVHPGTYDVFILSGRHDALGECNSHAFAALRAGPDIPPGRHFDWDHPIAELGVDSGRLAFYDAVRYPKTLSEHNALYKSTGSEKAVGGNLGVAFSSGFGDGGYCVYPCRFNGVIIGLLAWFVDDVFDEDGAIRELANHVPFLAARRRGDVMRDSFSPPIGSLADYTVQLAWHRYIELRVNAIETEELNAESYRALGRDPTPLEADVVRARATMAGVMRFLRTNMKAELGMDGRDCDRRLAFVSQAVEGYLAAARGLFFVSIGTLEGAKPERVSETDRLQRVDRAYKAEHELDAMLLLLFSSLTITGDAPPLPAD